MGRKAGKWIRTNFGAKRWFIPLYYLKMSNKTEEVCMLENWIHDISVNLEQIEQQFLLQDPFDPIGLKIMAILSYFVGLFASAIMLAFINYENGHHGNFRSVINQLLSNFYAMVSLYFKRYRNMHNFCFDILIWKKGLQKILGLIPFSKKSGLWEPRW